MGLSVQFRMHQREQLAQRFLVSVAPLVEQLGDRLSRGSRRRHRGFSPPQFVSPSRDFYSAARGIQKKLRRRGGFQAVFSPTHMNRHNNKPAGQKPK
jgi:hypothetical protein